MYPQDSPSSSSPTFPPCTFAPPRYYPADTRSTDMNQSLRDDPERKKFYENLTMLKRISSADEQAGSVVFLLSDYATCEYSRHPACVPSRVL